MNKFHEISTDSFIPLSHDNTYLFNHYDKIPNFIKARIGHKYGNILGKPVQRNYNIEWFSPFSGLKDISKANDNAALRQYFEFQDLLNSQLEQLSSSTDADARNWISLLEKVFDKENNIIYSNGKDISVIWGWKFENNTIHRPSFVVEHAEVETKNEQLSVEEESSIEPAKVKDPVLLPNEENIPEKFVDEHEKIIFEEIDPYTDNEEVVEDFVVPVKKGFLEFLKEFAARFWWLLIILLVLCGCIFFVKSLLYH